MERLTVFHSKASLGDVMKISSVKKRGKLLPDHILARDGSWRKSAKQFLDRIQEYAEPIGEITGCPVCGSSSVRVMVTVSGFRHDECLECRHVFCSVKFSPSTFDRLYKQDGDFVVFEPEMEVFLNRVREVAAPKVDFINEISGGSRPGDVWADIGCGLGDVLYSARETGWETLGFTPNTVEAEFCAQMGLTVKEVFLTAENAVRELPPEVRVVSMVNVLEHLDDPDPLLRALSLALRPGSFLAVEVPRNPSLSLFSIMCLPQSRARHLTAPCHLRLYSEKSLEMTLRQFGFEIAGGWTFGQDCYEMLSTLAQQQDLPVAVWPEIIAAINPMQQVLSEIGLDDAMLVVARKL